ncbi:MAG: PEP-CTERM sorting domain-containing protein [bacterium]
MLAHNRSLLVTLSLLLATSRAGLASMATVELKAQGDFVDPHEITVGVGDRVVLLYEVSNAIDLAYFQDDFEMSPATSPLSLHTGASWWESQPNVQANSLADRGGGVHRLVGEASQRVPPFAHSTVEPNSLAVLEFTCPQPGDVVVSGLRYPYFFATDVDGNPIGEIEIDRSFSDATVLIHQVEQQPPGPGGPWTLAYDVNDPLWGEVFGTPEGDYEDGAEIALTAVPLDEQYMFLRWEEATGGAVPGNPQLPDLGGPFLLASDLHLVATFAQVPEPLTLTVLAAAGAGLAWRGRRQRRR